MTEKKLNQIEQVNETDNSNIITENLSETLKEPDYPKIVLSHPGEDSPKIKTYKIENSYYANKGTCRSEHSRTYSVQDLVSIETSSYCSPDWRSYGYSIDKINLFPDEKDIPEEYDRTTSDGYWGWQYDYLVYDKDNKEIFHYSTGNQLSSQEHYFRVSPDDTVLFPWIETVEKCNWWYLHHIIIDNKSDYKDVKEDSIQDTIKALYDQKVKREQLEKYREKYWDIWLELPWTEYSSGYYQPRVYMWDKHWVPAHEHSNERWGTNSLLVKYGKPWDSINFYRWWEWYTVCIDDHKMIDIWNNTSSSRCNNQHWWYDELHESNIQRWQIFINGEDVYESTMSRISEKQKETKENRRNKFTELKDKLIKEYEFTESEISDICKYAWKWKVLSFLSTLVSMKEKSDVKKDEIMDAMKEIKYSDDMVLWNYVLIKRKEKTLKYEDVKRVVDKWYAWSYLFDNLPWIQAVWYFDDVIDALRLWLENWLFSRWNIVYTTKKSDSEVSDLGQKLLDAGIWSEKDK